LEFSELVCQEGQWFAILPLLSSMPDAGMPSLVCHRQLSAWILNAGGRLPYA